MRTLKLTVAYDGTEYAGWQIQRSRHPPSVQGTIQQVLRKIAQEPIRVIGSGRTDAGVHALAQVAHVKIRSQIPCPRLQQALNSLLPSDLVVTRVEEAADGFHACFDANAKRYRYCLVTGPLVLPFERRYVHHVRYPLDVPLMRREAKTLLGRHEVRVFGGSGRSVRNSRRTIVDIQVIRRDRTHLDVEIEATGFLYKMVRSIVGTLIDIGRGHTPPGTMARIVRTQDRSLVGPTVPARGLWLVEVSY